MMLPKGTLGKTIKQTRLERSLTQEKLAELVNITPTHLKQIESERRKPSIEVLFRLAKTLNFSIDNLIFPEPNVCLLYTSKLIAPYPFQSNANAFP